MRRRTNTLSVPRRRSSFVRREPPCRARETFRTDRNVPVTRREGRAARGRQSRGSGTLRRTTCTGPSRHDAIRCVLTTRSSSLIFDQCSGQIHHQLGSTFSFDALPAAMDAAPARGAAHHRKEPGKSGKSNPAQAHLRRAAPHATFRRARIAAPVAQWIEQGFPKAEVASSTLAGGASVQTLR